MTHPAIGIAAAAQASGLSAHILRAWERRYGFPVPLRVALGERLYTAEHVAKLTLLRRLIERGHRVGKVVGLAMPELEKLAGMDAAGVGEPAVSLDFQRCLQHLSVGSVGELRRLLGAALLRQGLARFVLDTARPLVKLVGDWWATDKIQVFQEHLFAEQLERLLREAMTPLEPDGGPTVVLTTLPGERHRLGLLMLEALLRLDGANCIPLGIETPPQEIAKLADMAKPQAIALSFSESYRDPQAPRALAALRRNLPETISLWIGGRGAPRLARNLRGVVLLPDLEDGSAAGRTLRGPAGGPPRSAG